MVTLHRDGAAIARELLGFGAKPWPFLAPLFSFVLLPARQAKTGQVDDVFPTASAFDFFHSQESIQTASYPLVN
jgi:hypothetical protein